MPKYIRLGGSAVAVCGTTNLSIGILLELVRIGDKYDLEINMIWRIIKGALPVSTPRPVSSAYHMPYTLETHTGVSPTVVPYLFGLVRGSGRKKIL